MNNSLLQNSIRFVVLLVLQIFVFNYMVVNFFGGANPYPYLIFILLLPMHINRIGLLTLCFVYGLILDAFSNSGGAHAAACLVLAYVRPLLLVSSFGISYEHQNLKFTDVTLKGVIIYVIVGCLLHHTVLFWLEVFSVVHLLFIVKQILLSTVFTSISVLLFFGITQNKKI